MNSAQFARVHEVTPVRTFTVQNEWNGEKSIVDWVSPPTEKFAPGDGQGDRLFCHRHQTYDDCTCTARVRLCGILTNTVVQVRRADVKPSPSLTR